MSEREKDTAFLRRCLLYDDSAERQQLEERMTRVQRDERCVWRAVRLMAVLTGLAAAGLGYAAVFLVEFPQDLAQLTSPLITRVFCALGVGSLICMLAFAGLGAIYRQDLNRRRAQCRRLVTNVLESRLGESPQQHEAKI